MRSPRITVETNDGPLLAEAVRHALDSAGIVYELVEVTRTKPDQDPEASELAELIAEHEIERLGPLGPVRCRACPNWTTGTIWDHRVAVLLSAMAEGRVGRQALLDAANAWTQGAWADQEWVNDIVRQRIASSNYFGDWLRKRARGES